MQRKAFLLAVLLTIGIGFLLAAGLSTEAGGKGRFADKDRPSLARIQGPLTVSITPVGPSQTQIDSALQAVKNYSAVRKYLDGTQNRQLSFELLEMEKFSQQQRFRVTYFDYTNNRPVIVESTFDDIRQTTVAIGTIQPPPSPEEFDAATEILKKDAKFGSLFKSGKASVYRPMPPLASESADSERALTVGIYTEESDPPNQIVAVNMIRGTVTAYGNDAPPTSLATPEQCGIPGAGQATTSRNTAGQYNLTISSGSTTVWQMLVIRPSASSGTRASGIELRDVYYLGKLLFKRAHVPILNVRYDNNTCGPYRDWQWQEGMFEATGTDVAPGIRIANAQPKTIIESQNDTGTFRGVAIYQNPTTSEITLVSELEAGWYRYISRWEFTLSGTVRARFGFDGVNNSCICNTHHHNVYWRFDFDIATAGRNRFVEYNTRSFSSPILTEVKRYRDYVRGRYWSIENIVSGEFLQIQPGAEDGVADFYARGDAWFLRYRSTELDDGVNTTGPNNTEAKLDNFVNGESLDGQDVVMWYGAHFDHTAETTSNTPQHHVGYYGPDLLIFRW
ncbi:MAG: hypothetical protein AB7P14_29525 [Blastocatellales bacterium]